MSCESVLDLLMAYRSQALEQDDHQHVTRHLDNCPACRTLESKLSQCLTSLRADPLPPPTNTWETILKSAKTITPPRAIDPNIAINVELRCTYCKDDLNEAGSVHCARCLARYHEECFAENKGCGVLGCEGSHLLRPETAKSISKGNKSSQSSKRALGLGILFSMVFTLLGITATRFQKRKVPIKALPSKQQPLILEEVPQLFKTVDRQRWRGLLGFDVNTSPSRKGLYIRNIQSALPPSKLSYATHDRLFSVAGTEILDHEDLISVLQRFSPGDNVPIDVIRAKNGLYSLENMQSFRHELGSLPPGFIGCYFAVSQEHFVVSKVLPNSAAWEAGIERGDRLLTMDGVAIKSPQQVTEMFGARTLGTRIPLRVLKHDGKGSPKKITVTLHARPPSKGKGKR